MAKKYWTGASSGNFQTAGNYSDGVAPANSDTIVFSSNSVVSVTAGLSNSLTGVILIVEPGYTGAIGTYAAGVLTYLVLDGGTLNCPAYPNSTNSAGSQLIAVNFGSTAATINIAASNSVGMDASLPPVIVKGTTLTAVMSGGSMGVAVRVGETATLVSIALIRGASSPSLILGAGVTVTAAVYSDGSIVDQRTITAAAIRLDGAGVSYRYLGTGACTAMVIDAGTAIYSGTGTLTAGTVNGGTLDFSQDQQAKTVTDLTVRSHGSVNANNGAPGSITFTNAVQFPEGLAAGMLLLPPAMKATIAAI